MNIVIIEAIEMYRGPLFNFLESENHFVMKYSDIDEFLPPPPVQIDLVILGKDNQNLIDAKQLLEIAPTLLISALDDTDFIRKALVSGFSYIHRTAEKDHILEAIENMSHNQFYIENHIKDLLIRKFIIESHNPYDLEKLSNRESDVFTLIGQGFNVKDIANQLNMSPKTVETHKSRIKDKFGLKSVKDLRKKAVQASLVECQS